MIKLKSYQREAVSNLKNGSILYGATGSGKSLTALFYYFEKICGGDLEKHNYKPKQTDKKLYIITTARKRDSLEWEGEFTNLGISIFEVVVDSWNNIHKYAHVKNAFFIFDEQRVVGSGTWVKSFLKITQFNEWILLSATPGDTWMDYIPVFIANGFYRNRTEFIQRHVVYSNFSKYPKVERYIETGRLIRLRNQILVTMKFVREITRHIQKVLVDYNSLEEDILLKDRWNLYEQKPIENISELCYILRRSCNSDPSRQIELLNIYTRHHKLIVFYNFNYELDILTKLCKEGGIIYSQWNGHKHENVPKDWSWMYFVQYNSGAEAWNCIDTDTTVFFSQNYSYRMMIQASGRIDRINSPFYDLYYYYLISNSKIDKAIDNALSKKKNFNETSFGKF